MIAVTVAYRGVDEGGCAGLFFPPLGPEHLGELEALSRSKGNPKSNASGADDEI